jgi:hypothetical protein
VAKLPLQHKIGKSGMICFAKPVLTEGFYTLQKEIALTLPKKKF